MKVNKLYDAFKHLSKQSIIFIDKDLKIVHLSHGDVLIIVMTSPNLDMFYMII